MPSLQQLLDAVDAVTKEFDPANVTVIVDATFGHRIDSSERDAYEEATSNGRIITPPAGVIGRGDAFILEVADRADAIVLSNDSFQEFHGKFDWLFEEGRLLGGKHVPGVGWIFLARSPVRGPTSRRAVSDAKRKRRGSKKAETSRPRKATKAKPKAAASSSRSSGSSARSSKAGGQAQRKSGGKEPEPYNEPLPFIEFVGAHPVGSVVQGEVEQFSSHGAYVLVDGTRCYVPLKALADPAPRSARDVLTLNETRDFVVVAIDTPRRGIDLAMPGVEVADDAADDDASGDDVVEEPSVSEDAPSGGRARGRSRSRTRERPAASGDAAPETETEQAPSRTPAEAAPAGGEQKLSVSQRRKLRAQQAAADEVTSEPETVRETMAQKKKASAKKAAAKKAPAKRKAAAKKAPAKRKATAKKAPVKKKSAAKKAPAKKKSTAKKAPAKKKSAAKKAPAKKKSTAKKAPAKKKSAAKRAGAAKKTQKRA